MSSPFYYKGFINPFLETYNIHHHGCHIDSIYCGSLDDFTLASFDSEELETMLNIQDHFTCTYLNAINHSKSQVFQINNTQSDANH